jgi:capsid assembly protease
MNDDQILAALFGDVIACEPRRFAALRAILPRMVAGDDVPKAEIEAAFGAPRGQARPTGAVAVLPLAGPIMQKPNLWTMFGMAVSTEEFGRTLRATLADETVRAVVLDVDSPGGSVFGVDELATEIYKARGDKPIVAVANAWAASAAYYIASQADELVVTPSGEVGSIGVYSMHIDFSAAIAADGVTITTIKAGKYKAEGNPYEPLTDEAKAYMQSRVNEYYGMFVAAVARGRGAAVSDVRDGMGEGRMVGAREAVRLGMADRVATLEETVQRMSGGGKRGGARAEGVVSISIAPEVLEAYGGNLDAAIADTERTGTGQDSDTQADTPPDMAQIDLWRRRLHLFGE